MTPHDFVAQLNAAVVEENHAIYRKLLLNTDIDRASDPYWRRVLSVFRDLSADQREVLLELTRQVTIDATANVLGVIDGSCPLGGEECQFRLISEGRDLSGDLQSLFLEQAEQNSP